MAMVYKKTRRGRKKGYTCFRVSFDFLVSLFCQRRRRRRRGPHSRVLRRRCCRGEKQTRVM
jgi:hypothetical protein